jgi:Rps23 Pro-64 3,4-dihydroxylase Tpa1-like proline 4-hydroxylase
MGRPGTVNTARRRAVVLTEVDTDEIGALFKAKVERAVPTVLEELQLPIRQPGRVSVQMTSTGDGGFYKPHTDNYVHDMNRRRLSFVYYCNRYPISFQGGILRIYDTREYAKLRDPKTKVHTVTPVQNRMVFFQSDYVHEISPVVCASNRLVDTRLTVNGWIYFA